MTKVISIITARSGSKRLVNKNIKKIQNKELIYFTIKASLDSNKIHETYVDTDTKKIKKIAEKYGAKVPFLRNKKFSHSNADSIETIKNFLKKLEKKIIEKLNYIVLLQPTSPLRASTHINKAIKLFEKNINNTSLVSVTKKPTMFLKKNQLFKKGKKFYFKYNKKNKKKITEILHANGAIYIFKKKYFFSKNPFGDNVLPFVMNIVDSIDIDYKEDFNLAKKLLD